MEQAKNLNGVYTARRKDGTVYYRASLTYRRKHISLGSFPSAELAHAAYKEGLSLVDASAEAGVPLPRLADYHSKCILSFEKWVCLINFRDSRMYFSTPIYIRPRFFYYYYSRELVLKFDIDDLFYYGARTIMKRGNHYFVADFGMQVNIQSRYGIKNYAVPGQDFRFRNGDNTDYRRENLEILNIYQGVSLTGPDNNRRYRARIHINGYYRLGTYNTKEAAAIAYNKAVDLLKKNGSTTVYATNYIDNVAPSMYAEIYSNIRLPQKFLDYCRELSHHFSE